MIAPGMERDQTTTAFSNPDFEPAETRDGTMIEALAQSLAGIATERDRAESGEHPELADLCDDAIVETEVELLAQIPRTPSDAAALLMVSVEYISGAYDNAVLVALARIAIDRAKTLLAEHYHSESGRFIEYYCSDYMRDRILGRRASVTVKPARWRDLEATELPAGEPA